MNRAGILLLACAACSTEAKTMDAGPPDGGPWECPPSPPMIGAPCPPPLACEYGDSKPCATYFGCAGMDQFSFRWGQGTTVCYPPPSCSQPLEAGARCPNTMGTFACDLDASYCGCTTCRGDGGQPLFSDGGIVREWACVPYANPGCPPQRPRFGSVCMREGIVCDYRQCWSGITVGESPAARCLAGLWIADLTVMCNQTVMPACL